MERELLTKALEAIKKAHTAFGAPGDYGYGTPQGDALFGLCQMEVEIHNHLRRAEAEKSN